MIVELAIGRQSWLYEEVHQSCCGRWMLELVIGCWSWSLEGGLLGTQNWSCEVSAGVVIGAQNWSLEVVVEVQGWSSELGM